MCCHQHSSQLTLLTTPDHPSRRQFCCHRQALLCPILAELPLDPNALHHNHMSLKGVNCDNLSCAFTPIQREQAVSFCCVYTPTALQRKWAEHTMKVMQTSWSLSYHFHPHPCCSSPGSHTTSCPSQCQAPGSTWGTLRSPSTTSSTSRAKTCSTSLQTTRPHATSPHPSLSTTTPWRAQTSLATCLSHGSHQSYQHRSARGTCPHFTLSTSLFLSHCVHVFICTEPQRLHAVNMPCHGFARADVQAHICCIIDKPCCSSAMLFLLLPAHLTCRVTCRASACLLSPL